MAITRPALIEGLDVNEVKDGLVVYESSRDRVHYLNATAAAIFTLCDGARDVEDIATLIAGLYHLDAPPVAEVQECVTTLSKEGLLR